MAAAAGVAAVAAVVADDQTHSAATVSNAETAAPATNGCGTHARTPRALARSRSEEIVDRAVTGSWPWTQRRWAQRRRPDSGRQRADPRTFCPAQHLALYGRRILPISPPPPSLSFCPANRSPNIAAAKKLHRPQSAERTRPSHPTPVMVTRPSTEVELTGWDGGAVLPGETLLAPQQASGVSRAASRDRMVNRVVAGTGP